MLPGSFSLHIKVSLGKIPNQELPLFVALLFSNLILKKWNRGENKVEIFPVLKYKKNFANVPNVITSDLRQCEIT